MEPHKQEAAQVVLGAILGMPVATEWRVLMARMVLLEQLDNPEQSDNILFLFKPATEQMVRAVKEVLAAVAAVANTVPFVSTVQEMAAEAAEAAAKAVKPDLVVLEAVALSGSTCTIMDLMAN